MVKADSAPPVATISPTAKSEAASLSVKVMLAFWPDLRALLSEVMPTVGETVSMLMDSWVAAVLLLPAASVKEPAATLKVAVVVLFPVGVNTAM